MEVSKNNDTPTSDDVSQVCPGIIKLRDSDTPDSNKGLHDHDSATDSPKITKPVLGKAQAKKRLMAFANNFRVSPVLKLKEKDTSVNKNQTINIFASSKKSNNGKDLMEEIKDARIRIEGELDFQELLNNPNSEKKNYKKHKKKLEPKISAIEEIIREESKHKMLLANIPDRIILENSEKNGRDGRNRDYSRYSQSNRNGARRSNSRSRGDRRRRNNGRRERSRSREKKEESHNIDKKINDSPEISQKNEMKVDKLEKSFKKSDKPREKRKNDTQKHDYKKDKRNEENHYSFDCESWKTFKSQDRRIRERLLSDNYEDTSTDVKFKTAEEYNGHLEQMLMIGSHRLERSYAVVNSKNDDRKIYPPESVRVTKCKGPPVFYCENPDISLFLKKEQLFQLLPPDRCSLLKKIIESTKEIKMEEKNENITERTWLKRWDVSIKKIEKQNRNKTLFHKQEANIVPKSRWDSAESILIQKDSSPSNSLENKNETESADDSSSTVIENRSEEQTKETSIASASTSVSKVEDVMKNPENDEKTIDDTLKAVEKTADANSFKVGEKLISEYEQFIKIVNNDSKELKNSKDKYSVTESNNENVQEKEEDDNKLVSMNHDKEKIELQLEIKGSKEDKSSSNHKSDSNEDVTDKHSKNFIKKLATSDWENEAEKDEKENDYAKDNKKIERKKLKSKKKESSSESSSSSSSSSSDSESQEATKKRKRKRKKKTSSSDSSSSESEESSDDAERNKKKRRRSKRRRSKNKSRTKKRRMKEKDTESNSSDSDEEDATRKKKQKRDSGKYRKTMKRRSKSADNKKVQKTTKIETVILEDETLDESDLENLKKKIVLEAESIDKQWPKDVSLSSEKPEEIANSEVEKNEKEFDAEKNETTKARNSVKDNKSAQPSPESKEIEKNTDCEVSIDHLDEKTAHSENSKDKKFRKTRSRDSSTSSSSSASSSSSSSSSSSETKHKSNKKQTKERSKRKSQDISSRLIKKFRKYHSKLRTSLDFNVLNFPSLTQLDQKINKNLSTMNDWEVDSQDETDEFIEKLKHKALKKEKKSEQDVRYDSKTDTYIAVEKKSQRENKKKQSGPVCALRIWEDEEEEGEREAMMLIKEKMDTDSKLKLWEPNVTENPVEEEKIIIPEELKLVKSPIIMEEEKEEEEEEVKEKEEENQSGWVEIIPEGGIKPPEKVSNSERKKPSRWSDRSPNMKELSEENLVPVNWEEEEVEWVRTSPEIKNKVFSSKRSRDSSDSSSDSSDSSSSSDSSDSEEESPMLPESLAKKLEHRDENSHSSSRSGSKELYQKSGLEEPYVETEVLKKLRMNIFADFVAKDSRDGFSEHLDSGGSSEIPLLVPRIPSRPLSSPLNDNSCFAPRPHEIDSTAEREAIRRGFHDFTPRSDSRSSSHDSRRKLSPKRDKERPRIRNSEERSNCSHQSGSRCSLGDSSRDRGRIDERNLRGHSPQVERKYSPFGERDFREKRRSPMSWDRARSRSRSWSRSRSRSPYRRDDRSWDRYKQSNYTNDRRERFPSRSPLRERSPFRRDCGKRSPEKDRSRGRSRDRTWSRDRSVDRSYNHLESIRNEYDINRKRGDDIGERDHWRDDNRISKESSKASYVNRLSPNVDFNDRPYHRNSSLDRNIDRGLIEDDFDKSRYRSRSRERKPRDFDWDRSRESPGLDSFDSRRRKIPETRSRLSPRPHSSTRLSRRCHSRSPSWSRSRTYSRSRSRSISRNRSRSRSRSSSRSKLRLNSLDRSSRFRRSRSLSPRRFLRVDDDRFRRSISQERGRRIETIIHPSGIKPILLGEPSNISETSEAHLSAAGGQYEYPYYQGNNLTYPPRLDNANPPSGSPKRLSLDDRLELELGIKKDHEPVPLSYNHLKYPQPMLQYPGIPSAPRGIIPQSVGSAEPIQQIAGPSRLNFHSPAGNSIISPNSLAPPAFNRQHASVVQVGNVLQVVPGDFSNSLPSTTIRNVIPNASVPGTSSNSENPNQVVRVGNVLQVVPTTTLDWSSRSPLQVGSILTNTMHMGVRPPIPIAPFSTTPVLHPNSHPIPAVSNAVPVKSQNKPISTPPLPIVALPKLEPPKAPPVIQPIYNYEAIMEARRKEKEERRRLRAEKRLEKKQKKLERLKRRAKRIQMKAEAKSESIETEVIGEDETKPSISIQEPKPGTSEDSNDQTIEQPEQTTLPVGEDEYDEEGDVEEDEDGMEFVNEEEVEDDVSKAMTSISQQVDADISKLAENPDAETVISNFNISVPLPLPPKKGILVPPGFWEEKFTHDNSGNVINNEEVNENDELNLNENQLASEQRDDDEENNENDHDKKLKTPRQRRARKFVQFADGVRPGEGTSPSGCEGDLPSPPPPVPISVNDPIHEQVKRSRIRKNRKKAKRTKPMKIKKKVKVKIIKLKKPKVTPLQAMMMGDSDEVDEHSSPPPPPPGSPPPPHLWPSYLAAYSATLRPADTVSPSGNQAPPPPTPLPLLVPPPPLNYTIQPLGKI